MARIRVNTEDLKNKAKDFDSAAEACRRAGDDILAAAMAMPSYDGQLSGPARKAGYEIQKQTRELSTALASDAESLRKTAQSFEEVDNAVITEISGSITTLRGAVLLAKYSGTPSTVCTFNTDSGGISGLLGWEDNGSTFTVFILGRTMVLDKSKLTDEQIEDYQEAVEDYYDALMALAFALGMDGAAVAALIGSILWSMVTVPADAFPGLGQVKAFADFLMMAGSALGVAVSTLACVWELYQVYDAYIDVVDEWNDLAATGAVITTTP
jgi:uncharacterized protein YukE